MCCIDAIALRSTTRVVTPKPTMEPGVWHAITFHYRPFSAEVHSTLITSFYYINNIIVTVDY